MKQLLFTLGILLCCFGLHAQVSSIIVEETLQWDEKPLRHELSNGDYLEFWRFEGASPDAAAPTLPVFTKRFPLDGPSLLQANLTDATYAPLAKKSSADDALLGSDIRVQTYVVQQKDRYFAVLKVVPLRKTGNASIERALRFSVRISVQPDPNPQERGGPFTTTSVLNDGEVFKFGIAFTGIYKLDYDFLKNKLGISNLDNIDPRSLKLYGNGGNMLPERNADARPDDLLENAIQVVGEADGKFDSGDYILFYAVGPETWTYRPGTDTRLTVRKHLYDRNAYYFLKISAGNGVRMTERESIAATYTTAQFDDFQRLEEERTNLLDFNSSSQGSGKRWFGDYFSQTRDKKYSFEFANVVTDSAARMRVEFAGRCDANTLVRATPSGGSTIQKTIGSVTTSNNDDLYARGAVLTSSFKPTGNSISVDISYPESAQPSEGWLDYIELNVRRKLDMSGDIMQFRDLNTIGVDATKFRLSNVNNTTVWDVTTPNAAVVQRSQDTGGALEFGVETKGILRNFIAWNGGAAFPVPQTPIGKIANQNLHGLTNYHMAVIYHPALEGQAKAFTTHRKATSGIEVAAVNVNDIFNEFSSGAKDPVALRDFARMLAERDPAKFEYLLLFGDGSFDPKNNTDSDDNLDLVPVWETAESFSPIQAYPSDDFFGLLSPNEDGSLTGALDIAVGRITARNATEAQSVLNKIIDYDSSPKTLGDWHLRGLYMADDEDGNLHINQADKLANESAQKRSWINLEKVYFDAYQQVATSGGARFPDAKAAINANMFKGALIAQYVGHGGPRGWAQERVIDNNDIAGWDNENRYPLVITATCSFGGHDDYSTLTGGEQALLKNQGGAIALYTTVRSVFIFDNNKLTDAVQAVIFEPINGKPRSIGETLRDAKNNLTIGVDNARRFTLLGDPSMYLAFPEHKVSTTKVNGKDYNAAQPDTLRALSEAEIEGMVTAEDGSLLADFNGTVTMAIFDKAQNLQTLGQDGGSPVRTFTVQRNVLFKGSATVANGRFKIKFVVPKDINYNYGRGKISYYAQNGTPLDAAGADDGLIIGGDANAIQDDQPPVVKVFLNTDGFAFGGITNDDPKILIKCSDDYGMNVSGSSLGHDLTAVLDDNVVETIVLNDFYESAKDNYKEGSALYPLQNLAPGKHTLKVKGWDIANNPGTGYTEFIVADNANAALAHVLNYPNPFTTNTNFQFEHNLAGQVLDVQISIFTVSGKLVKTLQHTTANTDGFRVSDIAWNGLDEYGDALARGVYLYRVKVRGTNLEGQQSTAESDFEKLVILK